MEFTPTSENAKKEVLEYSLKELTDKQLRNELSKRGYFVGNLWSTDDVKDRYECTDDEAQDILSMALTNEATMDQIWLSIDYACDELNIELS